MSSGMDATDFLKGLKLYEKAASGAAEIGMHEAVDQLYNDSVMKEPKVPIKEGNLRADVDRIVKVKGRTSIKGQIVFKQPYAAKQHEGVDFKFATPGTGAKYLESKIVKYYKRYIGIVARGIRSIT